MLPISDNGGIREAFLAYKKRLAFKGMEPSLPGLHGFTLDQVCLLLSYLGIQKTGMYNVHILVKVHFKSSWQHCTVVSFLVIK